jgi:hypothetical protein
MPDIMFAMQVESATRSFFPLVSLLAWLAAGAVAPAQNPPPNRPENLAQVENYYRDAQRLYGTNADFLVRYGLLACRTQRWVHAWAEATALSGNTPVEFWLIALDSGHDYEATAVSFAKPSDIHAALEFIGVRPGHPVSVRELQLWPKGERVNLFFQWTQGDRRQKIRAEELIVDTRTSAPLPTQGMVFAGSRMVVDVSATGVVSYAADTHGPNSIAANYNESGTVLDIPRQVDQGEVYGRQIPNPNYMFARGQLVEVVIEPQYPADCRRVQDLRLRVGPGASAAGTALADLAFHLDAATGEALTTNSQLSSVLAVFGQMTTRGQDPYLTLVMEDGLPLGGVRTVCQFVASIESEKGVRIEPPPEGHPYFRSFVPNEKFRNRADRPSQPLEFHLSPPGTNGLGVLTRIEEKYGENSDQPALQIQDTRMNSADDLRRALEAAEEGPKVVFLYAPATMRYGDLRRLSQMILATHPTLYVFLD